MEGVTYQEYCILLRRNVIIIADSNAYMKKLNLRKISLYAALVLVFSFSGFVAITQATTGVPSIMSYQGRLTDSDGNLLGSSSGTIYYFKFSIWDVATGGTASPDRLWPSGEPKSVPLTVRQGVFNVDIGDTVGGYPDALDYDFNTASDIYLQVEVSSTDGSFQALSPRQRISATPFAKLSGAVSGIGPSSFGTTTPFANSIVSVKSTSTSSIPLAVQGIAGQTANLFQIQGYDGSNLFSVNSLGGIFGSSSFTIGTTASKSFIVTNKGSVGAGTFSPQRRLEVLDVNSVPQLRLSQTSDLYGEFYVDSAGDVRLSSQGKNIRMNDENLWVCNGGACGIEDSPPTGNGNVIVESGVVFGNKFTFKQINPTTVIMYDSTGSETLEFDEGK